MGTITSFPNGISSEGFRFRAGTYVNSGTTAGTVDTGLGTCNYVVASLAAAGTGQAMVAATPSGANAVFAVYAASGSAATVGGGTIHWIAAGS